MKYEICTMIDLAHLGYKGRGGCHWLESEPGVAKPREKRTKFDEAHSTFERRREQEIKAPKVGPALNRFVFNGAGFRFRQSAPAGHSVYSSSHFHLRVHCPSNLCNMGHGWVIISSYSLAAVGCVDLFSEIN